MRGNLFYIVHPAGQLKNLNLRADLGKIEEKLETLRNAIENLDPDDLDPDECRPALSRWCREIDCMLRVVQKTHKKADRGFVRVWDEEGPGNGG